MQCVIPLSKKLNCRPLRIPSYVTSVEHMRMTESINFVLNLVEKRNLNLHESDEDNVDINLYYGKLVCTSKLWPIICGIKGRKIDDMVIKVSDIGICFLIGMKERKTAIC